MCCTVSHPFRCPHHSVGWFIAMGHYSSLCEGAVVSSLDAVDIGEEVLGRVQVERGREEVNNREKQEKDRSRTQQQTLKHTSRMT